MAPYPTGSTPSGGGTGRAARRRWRYRRDFCHARRSERATLAWYQGNEIVGRNCGRIQARAACSKA